MERLWRRDSLILLTLHSLTCIRYLQSCFLGLCVCLVLIFGATTAWGAEIDECRKLLLQGEYEKCLSTTRDAIEKGVYGESWHLVKADAEFQMGRYAESLATIHAALERYGWSVRLRWEAMRVCRYLNQTEQVEKYVAEIAQLVQASPWRYTDAENLVTLGEFIIEQGADAKEAQDAFLTRARRNNPLHRAPALALGELALDKRDFQLAGEIFTAALETHPEDPDMNFGMARAFADSDQEVSNSYLQKCLAGNPHHAGALLFQVDRLIDGEQYAAADELIAQVLKVNPKHPEALAFRTSILMLQSDDPSWSEVRDLALSTWGSNPLVDHTIGRKLSQKYRFQQGSTFQRQALQFDANFAPAKKQLIQDLLRLGKEEEGWQLADEFYATDPYDVGVYNLVTLRDEIEKFVTLEEPGLQIRMETQEAAVYGQRVLQLLSEARIQLAARYELEIPETILVEIFPRPSDFEVRTFGMPGIVGFLGVCFGDVITVNSPASQAASPVNLDSVLWHEFTHVITLNKTNNRMPRWLSEGISVYEERQRDPAWGERMNLAYRQMILGGELSKIGEMSQMFLSPKSPMHVQFAYFQSSLIVEHLIDEYGFPALLAILDDLAVGMSINESIPRQTAPLKELDEKFSKYAIALATEFGADVDWTAPELVVPAATADLKDIALAWAEENPQSYMGLKAWAKRLQDVQDEKTAEDLLIRAVTLFSNEAGAESPLLMLAELYHQQLKIDKEEAVLIQYTALDDDAATVYLRLIEIAEAQQNWEKVQRFATKLLSVKPLIPQPHVALAAASEQLDQPEAAISAIESVLLLEPADQAGWYYRKAVQQQKLDRREPARRSTLQALEEAPRYRDALKLLVELNE